MGNQFFRLKKPFENQYYNSRLDIFFELGHCNPRSLNQVIWQPVIESSYFQVKNIYQSQKIKESCSFLFKKHIYHTEQLWSSQLDYYYG